MNPPVSLADRRLVERLRRGEPGAADELWVARRDAVWAVCRAMADSRDAAVALLQQVYLELPRAGRGFDPQAPVCCGVAAWLWRDIGGLLELPPLVDIEPVPPDRHAELSPAQVVGRLGALEPNVRLVYLIDLYFGCPVGRLAELVAIAEPDLRAARTQAVWGLLGQGAL